MKKLLPFAILATLLTACASDDTSENTTETVETFNITGISGNTTISTSVTTDVVISGVTNTVNIESNLRKLEVSGTNNAVNFADGVTVETCTITGTDNSAVKTGTVTINCNDTGSGNTGF